MRSAIWVLNIFALIWSAAPIAILGWPAGLFVIPFTIACLIAIWSGRHVEWPRKDSEQAAAWKSVLLWSGIEVAAILVAAVLLVRLDAPEAVMPAVAIIVGLHFLPLASSIGVPLYRATAAGLVAVGTIALFLPFAARPPMIGFGAAAILWSSCAVMIGRGRVARTAR